MLCCSRSQTDFQRWMVRYEIARQKAVDAWLDITTPRPDPAGAPVTAEVDRLRDAARERLQAETGQTYDGVHVALGKNARASQQQSDEDTFNPGRGPGIFLRHPRVRRNRLGGGDPAEWLLHP